MANERAPMSFQPQAGDEVIVELPSSPGAGAIWFAPAGIEGCTVRRLDNAEDPTSVGGGTTQRFAIRCDRPGDWRLVFEFKRPWEDTVRSLQPVEIKAR